MSTPKTPHPATGGIDIGSAPAVVAREDEGQSVHIREASGELAYFSANGGPPAPVTITVAGTYSAAYRRQLDAQRDRMLKARRNLLTADQLTANQIELVAACILAWAGFTNGGAPFPCTRDNAVLLLTKAPWVRDQLEEAMGDHAGFFATASTT
jgi:hypothetical protein